MQYILIDGIWKLVAVVMTYLTGASLMFLTIVTVATIGVILCLYVLVCQWRASAKKRKDAE